jgi:hypothetical protein
MSDTEALASKLHVHKSIVTYNAHRFRAQFFSVMDLRAWFRRQVVVVDDERQAPVDEPRINSQQVALILEFYLHMDGRRISLSRSLSISLFSRCFRHENVFVSWCSTTLAESRSLL